MGDKRNKLLPSAKPIFEQKCNQWINDDDHNKETTHLVLTIAQAMSLKENIEDNLINHYISINPYFLQHFGWQPTHEQDHIDSLLEHIFQEECSAEDLNSVVLSTFPIYSMIECGSKTIEIFPGKPLNINYSLDNT